MAAPLRPRVFLDIAIGIESAGSLQFELFDDKTPRTCKRFIELCTGIGLSPEPSRSIRNSTLNPSVEDVLTCVPHSSVPSFIAEDPAWRIADIKGLLCAVAGSNQFFITLAPKPETKDIVFGQLLQGEELLDRMATAHLPMSILDCGEYSTPPASPAMDLPPHEERGRLKRRRQSTHSPPRASSPSRGHDRDSGSRYRHHHRKHHRQSSSASITPPPSAKKSRRRSDAEPDHNQRGRARLRSRSRTGSPIFESDSAEEDFEARRRGRKRSPPPSRHRSESVIDVRRQRSLPNMYKKGMPKKRDSFTGEEHDDGMPGKENNAPHCET